VGRADAAHAAPDPAPAPDPADAAHAGA
jgi:hypothetical protein